MIGTDATGPGEGRPRIALVLPGGGARSAYQVGVLKAIAGWCRPGEPLPFSILCGTSAGAINVAVIGAGAAAFPHAAAELARVWGAFRVSQVFRSGAVDMLRSGLHLLLALVSGGWLLAVPRSLFNNSPLRALLSREIDFARLSQATRSGALDAIAVTATGLGGGESVTFVQSAGSFEPWNRAGRRGVAADINIDHLMASSAIPLLFAAVPIGHFHFSDGAMRQTMLLAPAIHLGADRILVIGARSSRIDPPVPDKPPNIGEMVGFMLDTLFMEGLHADLERVERTNALLDHLQDCAPPLGLRRIETLLMLPRSDPREIAIANRAAMPRTLRALLRVLGVAGERGGRLISYLMFAAPFTRELIRLGVQDAEARRDEISSFLGLESHFGKAL
ncbi:MAG: patatin-like phospholipase family protein [Gammaproteobacteria bacterium]|nr:patatin-like phospholipase family protein [Gammaproteobacteria bacterium]